MPSRIKLLGAYHLFHRFWNEVANGFIVSEALSNIRGRDVDQWCLNQPYISVVIQLRFFGMWPWVNVKTIILQNKFIVFPFWQIF